MDLGDIMDSVKLGNAMNKSDEPDPREEYPSFPDDELLAFMGRAEDMGLLTMENILRGPLGFWMFTLWMSRHPDKTMHNVGQFIVEVTKLKENRGKHIEEQYNFIMANFFPEMQSAVNEMKPEYASPDMRRTVRKPETTPDLYKKHIKEMKLGNMARETTSKTARRASVVSQWITSP